MLEKSYLKIFLLFIAVIVSTIGCDTAKPEEQAEETYSIYGADFSKEGIIEAGQLTSTLGSQDSLKLITTGTVKEVCQMKGCWMTIDLENGEKMRVTFKDYGFFVPKDIAGQKVVIDGYAYNSITDVETLRHFAEDAGSPQEEIDAITEDKQEITFVANGVAIPGN